MSIIGTSRDQAIAYLESIPLTFLSQIHDSLKTLNKREKSRRKSKNKKNIKGKRTTKKRKALSDEDETKGRSVTDSNAGSESLGDQEENGQSKRKFDDSKVAQGPVGVTMKLKNRSTG